MTTSFKVGDIIRYEHDDHDWEVLQISDVPSEVSGNLTKCGATYVYIIPVPAKTDWTPGTRFTQVEIRLNITDGKGDWSLVRPDEIVYVNLWIEDGKPTCGLEYHILEGATSRNCTPTSSGAKLGTLKINKTQHTVEVVK